MHLSLRLCQKAFVAMSTDLWLPYIWWEFIFPVKRLGRINNRSGIEKRIRRFPDPGILSLAARAFMDLLIEKRNARGAAKQS